MAPGPYECYCIAKHQHTLLLVDASPGREGELTRLVESLLWAWADGVCAVVATATLGAGADGEGGVGEEGVARRIGCLIATAAVAAEDLRLDDTEYRCTLGHDDTRLYKLGTYLKMP